MRRSDWTWELKERSRSESQKKKSVVDVQNDKKIKKCKERFHDKMMWRASRWRSSSSCSSYFFLPSQSTSGCLSIIMRRILRVTSLTQCISCSRWFEGWRRWRFSLSLSWSDPKTRSYIITRDSWLMTQSVAQVSHSTPYLKSCWKRSNGRIRSEVTSDSLSPNSQPLNVCLKGGKYLCSSVSVPRMSLIGWGFFETYKRQKYQGDNEERDTDSLPVLELQRRAKPLPPPPSFPSFWPLLLLSFDTWFIKEVWYLLRLHPSPPPSSLLVMINPDKFSIFFPSTLLSFLYLFSLFISVMNQGPKDNDWGLQSF